MRTFAAAAALCFGFLVALPAAAKEPFAWSSPYCIDKQVALDRKMDCLGEELEHADYALNEVWKTGFPKMADDVKAPLRQAQREWAKFRDSQCAADAAAAANGASSLVPVFYTNCLTSRTHKRRLELEQFFRREAN